MAKSKSKVVYVCQSCGAQRSRWEGRCSECGEWNTLVEEVSVQQDKGRGWAVGAQGDSSSLMTISLEKTVKEVQHQRLSTSIGEMDRVLGGGLVPGSFVLLGGDPGIGKSTLLLQMAGGLAKSDQHILYISAEESVAQTALRAQRLGIRSAQVEIASESNLEMLVELAKKKSPDVLIVDSIQTVYLPTIQSAPGSVAQVRECAAYLMGLAKNQNIAVFIIGHVTKEGTIAGPRVLEHMVDAVLSFEGDPNHQYRLLRALKNRFGATHELGVFQMANQGLDEVANPSEMFLAERGESQIGSTVFASMEGTRPVLCEIQSLAVKSYMAAPRRTALGLDAQRIHLLCAVLDKQLDLDLAHHDVFVNVVGGLKVSEPAADLAFCASLISCMSDKPIDPNACYMGEVGLTGEIRAVNFVDLRLKEARKLGFSKFYVPENNRRHLKGSDLTGVVFVKSLRQL